VKTNKFEANYEDAVLTLATYVPYDRPVGFELT